MKKFIFYLISAFLLASVEAKALKIGDDVFYVLVKVTEKKGVVLGVSRIAYKSYNTDIDYRSKNKTDWRAVLLGKDGQTIESTYFVMKENQRNISDWPEGAKVPKDSMEPFDRARIVFSYAEDAEKVEIYRKGKLVASAIAPHSNREN